MADEKSKIKPRRRFPIGAEVLSYGGVHFRVWAPRCQNVELILEEDGKEMATYHLETEADGYFSLLVSNVKAGSLYRYRLDQSADLYPDPASRFQPDGPHGPSCVIDYTKFHWTERNWSGVNLAGQVIYEMHIGTFTQEGTWQAAIKELPSLVDVGITLLEVMPVAEFPGRFGWGYDGVDLFAPSHLYGKPDDFRDFINAAHSLGMGVILDVVYNHLGPDGNYLKMFSENYFSDRYKNEWGEAINFDGINSQFVREFILSNACYWIDEFHLDGLRLDATQQIFDDSPEHIIASLTKAVRVASGWRSTILTAENEPQQVQLLRLVTQGGCGLDALWNDDFHHSAVVALTGHREAYYSDYLGTPQEFISMAKWGFLFQGQYSTWQKQIRGTPTQGIKPECFINFIQNHDQIANSAQGLRLSFLTSPGCYRAFTALLLLLPATPLLFQGQEFASSAPFLYFADHNPELAKLVEKGRVDFLSQFPSLVSAEVLSYLPKPQDEMTFKKCKLDFAERELHHEVHDLHRDLLKLRREDSVFNRKKFKKLDGAVLGEFSFLLRYFGEADDDRLLFINYGSDLSLIPASESLLAPPHEKKWEVLWSSEHLKYGGMGVVDLDFEESCKIFGGSAIVMKSI